MAEPVLEGWFTLDEQAPRLLGTRCPSCGTYHFPPQQIFCRNPACSNDELEDVELSRSGRLWSFTNACYPPPAPYVAADPFEPYAIAAVELADEQLVVLGQVVDGIGVEDLQIGMDMELTLGTVPAADGETKQTWKWRPASGGA